MKLLLVSLCAFLLGAGAVIASPIAQQQQQQQQLRSPHLLGARECTFGPTYWCYNITNAAGCGAVKHCIQTVWEKHAVPEDSDSICEICLDMVQQARDQLNSNATQEDLKAVFEGSCLLIPLKPIEMMCIRTVDNFIPELVEALSSQMNPQAVCSIAGLCNNAAIDKMLADAAASTSHGNVATTISATAVQSPVQPAPLTCKQCNSIGGIIAQKFRTADRDQLLEAALRQCGRLSSLSDGCSSLVLTYFNHMYEHMRQHLTAPSICHLAGVCADRFHQHDEDVDDDDDDDDDVSDDDLPITAEQLDLVVRPMSDVGVVRVNDDIPCELCKQLVHHLKELLIANTTEIEFKSVLEGLCKQTGGFKAECLSIVDQYYIKIYNTLLTELDENEACCAIQICPRGLQSAAAAAAVNAGEIAPLLPAIQAQHLFVHITAKPKVQPPKRFVLGADEPVLSAAAIQSAQLPIDRLLGAPNGGQLIEGGNLCVVCEYAAHFVQTALANTQTEAEIKDYMKTMCELVTPKLRSQCDSFIDQYGDALIALAIQEVDPREICPRLFVCAAQREEAAELLPLAAVEINKARNGAAEKCPLCLFAVAQAVAAVKTDRSVAHIEYVLSRLCGELPGKMKAECADFVETYTAELVRMLADDFTPQAICTNLQLCDPAKMTLPAGGLRRIGDGDLATNVIPDLTFNGDALEAISVSSSTPNCLLCVEVVKQVEKRVSNKKSRAQLKEALEHACHKMPKLEAKCDSLVDRYGDKIVDLMLAEFSPKQICRELGQCVLSMRLDFADEASAQNMMGGRVETVAVATVAVRANPLCDVCDTVMTQLEEELKDKDSQKKIEETVKGICHQLPAKYDAQCSKFIDQYAAFIIALIDTTPPKQICAKLGLCTTGDVTDVQMLGHSLLDRPDMAYVHVDETTICVLCETVMTQLEQQLASNATLAEIETALKGICHQLPSKYDAQCAQFIDSYATTVMALIDTTPPKLICASLSLCSARKRVVGDGGALLGVVERETKVEVTECAICHAASLAMTKLLENSRVQRSVENVLDRTCNQLPGAFNDRCIAMVEAYGQSMLNIIGGSSELQTLCTQIGMCHPNEYQSFAQITPSVGH